MLDDKTYFTILGAVVTVYGLYCLYIWLKLVIDKYLFFNQILIPSGYAVRDCKRPGEYIKFMKPRLLFFGIIITLTGVVNILSAQLLQLSTTVFWILMGVAIAVIIWFIITLIATRRRYWED